MTYNYYFILFYFISFGVETRNAIIEQINEIKKKKYYYH